MIITGKRRNITAAAATYISVNVGWSSRMSDGRIEKGSCWGSWREAVVLVDRRSFFFPSDHAFAPNVPRLVLQSTVIDSLKITRDRDDAVKS
jgi:hypothetical protein